METVPEDELLKGLYSAIDAKRHAAYDNIVLVLEGWPPKNHNVLERLSKEFSEHLGKIGFQEIWYSERGPGGQVRRLHPV